MKSFQSEKVGSNSSKSKKQKYDDQITLEYDLNNTIKKEKNLQAYYQSILNEKKDKIKELNEDLNELFQNRTNLNKDINNLEDDLEEKKKIKYEVDNNFEILKEKKIILYNKLCDLEKENFLDNLKIENLKKENLILDKRNEEKKKISDQLFKKVINEKKNKLKNENNLNKIMKKIKINRLKLIKIDDLPENVLKISIMCQKIIKKFENICEEIKNTPKKINKMQVNKKLTKIFDTIKDLKSKLLKEKVNYNFLEQRQQILNYIKKNTKKEIKKLEETQTKNKILNEHVLSEFYESKNKYLDLFFEELKTLKNLKYPDENKINQKMESIQLYINDEKNQKLCYNNKKFENSNNYHNSNIAKTMNEIEMVEEFKKQTTDSIVSDFDNISFISNIQSNLNFNNKSPNSNIQLYEQQNNNYNSFTDRKLSLRESKSKPQLFSARGDNSNNLFKRNNVLQRKFTQKQLNDYNTNFKKSTKSKDSYELNEQWGKIVKTFKKIMNSIFKSSCLLASNLFSITKEICKNDKKLIRSKNFINKFMKESLTRHKTSMSKISAYRSLKNVPLKALLSCLGKLTEIILTERKIQDKFSVSICDFFSSKKN